MICQGNNRKRIAIIAGAGAGAAGVITYVSLAANPVAAAALPVVLVFAACPAMCAAMGGVIWLSRRFSKRKNQAQIQQPVVNSKEEEVEVKTESIDRNQQQLTYQQKRRKDKAAEQDTSAISD